MAFERMDHTICFALQGWDFLRNQQFTFVLQKYYLTFYVEMTHITNAHHVFVNMTKKCVYRHNVCHNSNEDILIFFHISKHITQHEMYNHIYRMICEIIPLHPSCGLVAHGVLHTSEAVKICFLFLAGVYRTAL